MPGSKLNNSLVSVKFDQSSVPDSVTFEIFCQDPATYLFSVALPNARGSVHLVLSSIELPLFIVLTD